MRLAALVSLLLATGCSAAVVGDGPGEDVDPTEANAQGALVVERVAAGQELSTHVSARFVRVRGGIDHQTAEQVVGSASGLAPDAALGCAWQDGSTEEVPTGVSDGSIELLDVGDIVLRAGTTVMPLAARAFPDVGDLISGVVYTSRDDSTDLPAAGSYAIDVAGSPFIEGFSLQVEAPSAPTGVQLAQLGVEAQPFDAAELELTPGEDLNITWESDNQDDRIYVELSPGDAGSRGSAPRGSGATLRCVFDDVGGALVPAAMMNFSPSSEIDITVHRYRSTQFDAAVVDFDFGVATRVTTSE
jgi:hypothetical protein